MVVPFGQKGGLNGGHFGSKQYSAHGTLASKSHPHVSTRGNVRVIPTSSGLGHTGAGGIPAGGNAHHPVTTGQRDGQIRDYKRVSNPNSSRLEKRKREDRL
jgi:hypothetical protein